MSRPGKRILVVEDDCDIAESLKDLLEGEGYEVDLASDGEAALRKLRESGAQPGLIILDLMMPRLDGFEFREKQAEDPALAGIPVAIMTADGHIELKRRRLRAQAFLKKPVEVDTVLDLAARYT